MREDWMRLAQQRDRADPLTRLGEGFECPPGPDGRPADYLTGHSLGLLPRSARTLVEEEFSAWSTYAVEGHVRAPRPWVSYHEQLTPLVARIVGARPKEVVVMNSLTINLHLMMVSFYRPTADRHAIVIEKGAFPSARYAIVSQLEYHGYRAEDALIEIEPREGEVHIREEDVEAVLAREGGRVALVLWPGALRGPGMPPAPWLALTLRMRWVIFSSTFMAATRTSPYGAATSTSTADPGHQAVVS